MATVVGDIDFQEVVLESDIPVMVDFFATWCGPCKMISPAVEELKQEMEGKAKVVKVDIDQSAAIAQKYGIMGVPTLLYFKNGKIEDQVVGAVPKEVMEAKLSALL